MERSIKVRVNCTLLYTGYFTKHSYKKVNCNITCLVIFMEDWMKRTVGEVIMAKKLVYQIQEAVMKIQAYFLLRKNTVVN